MSAMTMILLTNNLRLLFIKQSEAVIKELIAENTKMQSTINALRIEKHLNTLKLSQLKKNTNDTHEDSSSPVEILPEENNVEVITIDSDDD